MIRDNSWEGGINIRVKGGIGILLLVLFFIQLFQGCSYYNEQVKEDKIIIEHKLSSVERATKGEHIIKYITEPFVLTTFVEAVMYDENWEIIETENFGSSRDYWKDQIKHFFYFNPTFKSAISDEYCFLNEDNLEFSETLITIDEYYAYTKQIGVLEEEKLETEDNYQIVWGKVTYESKWIKLYGEWFIKEYGFFLDLEGQKIPKGEST